MKEAEQKRCFITGANSGIGKEAAVQLAVLGFHVFVGARNRERGEAAIVEIKERSCSTSVELVIIDLSSRNSIVEAADLLRNKCQKLDVLIHNAADFNISQKEVKKSVDGIETIWATNHLGPIRLTALLLELLKSAEQGRIITIASKGLIMQPRLEVDLDDPEFKHRKFSVPKAYYQSKLAQIMYTYHLAEELKSTAVTVNCIRVTNVKIDINRYPNISGFMKFMYSIKSRFSISAEEMARTYTYLASSKKCSQLSGKYYDEKNELIDSSAYSKKKENIEAVMQLSMKHLN